MKKILFKIFIINILLFVVSCSTSNEFNLNSRLQKRRYSNGYYLSSFKKIKNHKNETETGLSNNEKHDEIEIINRNTDNSTYASLENETIIISTTSENEMKNDKIDSQEFISRKDYLSEKLIVSLNRNNIESKISNQTEYELNVDKKSIKSYLKRNSYSKIDDEKLLTILFFVLAIVLPPLSVLLYTNIDWKKVLIATLLTCLWWVPGVIYAILVLLEIL